MREKGSDKEHSVNVDYFKFSRRGIRDSRRVLESASRREVEYGC